MTEPFRVAGVQMDVEIGQPRANCERIEAFLAETAVEDVSLTVFPECSISGYCFEDLDEAKEVAEPIGGPSTERLVAACAKHGSHAIVGLLERQGDEVYNSCCLLGPQGVVATYRKTHLPHLGIDRFTTPGEGPFECHEIRDIKVGMHICYDARFPEVCRALALSGSDLVVLPTNWPAESVNTSGVLPAARSFENKVYFLAVNRIGHERGTHFPGRSIFCDPWGNTLARAEEDREEILIAEVDPAKAREKNLVRRPGTYELHLFNDRRPDLYGALTKED
ncbi:(R)-stereoselective amidase [Planctomycetes bacterium Pan216]|uniref:(R)-stereoselective amidase n=1 Tax=Kolteria novifilia TaxID=2527975 RepID=A0A518B843_9BACT|nr:(R)-stereoselective amidase [Planctomycetes bacterium Pan216]